MNCLDFRRTCLTDPYNNTTALREHRRVCRVCAAFAAGQIAFNHALQRAMNINLPARLAARIVLRQSRLESTLAVQRRHQTIHALAASLLLSVAVSIGTMRYHTADTLDNTVVSYLQAQPPLPLTSAGSTGDEASALLKPLGMALRADGLPVRYARPCAIKGTPAVYLITAGEKGPVSVLLMPEQHTTGRRRIEQTGLNGVIVPCPKGSMAIVGTREEPLADIERRVRSTVVWM